jgi:hypothetical protein
MTDIFIHSGFYQFKVFYLGNSIKIILFKLQNRNNPYRQSYNSQNIPYNEESIPMIKIPYIRSPITNARL